MANPMFPNVNPLPFRYPQAPMAFPSIAGMRSFDPALPPVGGYSPEDLERMRFALMQSGMDPAMLGRIQQVMAMRGGSNQPTAVDLEAQLLRPTQRKRAAVGWRQANPFDVAADAMIQ